MLSRWSRLPRKNARGRSSAIVSSSQRPTNWRESSVATPDVTKGLAVKLLVTDWQHRASGEFKAFRRYRPLWRTLQLGRRVAKEAGA